MHVDVVFVHVMMAVVAVEVVVVVVVVEVAVVVEEYIVVAVVVPLMHELGLWLFDIVGIAFVGASEVDMDKVDMASLTWVGTT